MEHLKSFNISGNNLTLWEAEEHGKVIRLGNFSSTFKSKKINPKIIIIEDCKHLKIEDFISIIKNRKNGSNLKVKNISMYEKMYKEVIPYLSNSHDIQVTPIPKQETLPLNEDKYSTVYFAEVENFQGETIGLGIGITAKDPITRNKEQSVTWIRRKVIGTICFKGIEESNGRVEACPEAKHLEKHLIGLPDWQEYKIGPEDFRYEGLNKSNQPKN